MEDVINFYEWLLKIKSIHLSDNEKMFRAYEIVYKNSKEKCTQST